MSWLVAAYGAVAIAVGLYAWRLVRLRRAVEREAHGPRPPS